MQQGPVGRRYARALISSLEGANQDRLTQVEEQLSAVAALLDKRSGNTDFRQAMLNPSFSPEQRKAVLADMGKAFSLDDAAVKFMRLLVEKGRLPQLPTVARAFRDEVDAQVGRVRATIVTAKPLDSSALLEIVRSLEQRTGKKVVPEVEVDPGVIAGVQAKIGGMLFDATVKNQLDRLKQNFAIQ
jgi:F-type H+-transporting ATPase subunit delta